MQQNSHKVKVKGQGQEDYWVGLKPGQHYFNS